MSRERSRIFTTFIMMVLVWLGVSAVRLALLSDLTPPWKHPTSDSANIAQIKVCISEVHILHLQSTLRHPRHRAPFHRLTIRFWSYNPVSTSGTARGCGCSGSGIAHSDPPAKRWSCTARSCAFRRRARPPLLSRYCCC